MFILHFVAPSVLFHVCVCTCVEYIYNRNISGSLLLVVFIVWM